MNGPAQGATLKWKHLSSVNGDLPVPNMGQEQTASLVCDIDKEGFKGVNEHAGLAQADIDGDGKLDIVRPCPRMESLTTPKVVLTIRSREVNPAGRLSANTIGSAPRNPRHVSTTPQE